MNKIPSVQISRIEDKFKDIDLPLSPEYKPCEEIFPQWITSRIILTDFCNKILGWKVSILENAIYASLQYPFVVDGFDEVSLVLSFPEEDRYKVINICESVHRDYFPNPDQFLNEMADERLQYKVSLWLDRYENYVINCGGRSAVDEVRYRLGILDIMGLRVCNKVYMDDE